MTVLIDLPPLWPFVLGLLSIGVGLGLLIAWLL